MRIQENADNNRSKILHKVVNKLIHYPMTTLLHKVCLSVVCFIVSYIGISCNWDSNSPFTLEARTVPEQFLAVM